MLEGLRSHCWLWRIDRRYPIEALRQLGVDTLLDELDRSHPPHFEAAFIAREVKRQLVTHEADWQKQIVLLGRKIARLSFCAYVVGIIIGSWLIAFGWRRIRPPPFKPK